MTSKPDFIARKTREPYVLRPWGKDVQDIADQLVMGGLEFERGVGYVGEMADLVMKARAERVPSNGRHEESVDPFWCPAAADRTAAEERLWDSVIAIWTHTVKHATFEEGVGYVTRSNVQTCQDPEEHARLALEEGSAFRAWLQNTAQAHPSVKEEAI